MVWSAGHQLQNGKYVIGEVLGRGGFGITYKALHVRLQEEVVVKTPDKYLKTDPQYSKFVERFIKEGQMLAKLSRNSHPNIVRVRDLFQEGETHCLVMDFVPGENLFQVVKRRGKLAKAEATICMRQIAEALATIHKAGLVHRDAHPGNIILRDDGRAILIDFGIAKELVPATMSSTGDAGHKGFAPYEQLTRGSREPNADVYCLAATLYYAVTGQYPATSLERKLHDVVLVPPQQIEPAISTQLNGAILKGMALEAQERPQSMQEWLELLETPRQPKPTKPSTVNVPPAVNPDYRRESVRSGSSSERSSSQKPKPRKTKVIPWGWLTGIVLLYAVQGWAVAGAEAVAVAVAGAVAVAVVEAVVGAVVGAVAVAVAGAVVVVGAVVGAVAVDVAVAGAGAVAVAVDVAVAEAKLQKSFSRFHTFLILAGTLTLGLGLGWLISVVSKQ